MDTAGAMVLLGRATTVEDLFGVLEGTPAEQLAAVKQRYRELVRLIHPGHLPLAQAGRAEAALARLNQLKDQAEAAIEAAQAPVVIHGRKQVYTVAESLGRDDLADHYRCCYDGDQPAILKVARRPADTDLMRAEADVLRHLRTPDRPEASGFFPYLPEVIDHFSFRENGSGPRRTANVLAMPPGYYSLAEVQKAYPAGISPKHMAWMWRQLLQALGYVHARGVIHGAVLPPHIQIHPEGHDLMLTGWCCAVRDTTGSSRHIPAISLEYESWYPPEVTAKAPPTPGTDLLMAARCMLAIMGGDPLTGQLPQVVAGEPVPPPLGSFLRSCLLPVPRQRPQDAWQLRDEFTQLIQRLWGPRQRIPFTMPAR